MFVFLLVAQVRNVVNLLGIKWPVDSSPNLEASVIHLLRALSARRRRHGFVKIHYDRQSIRLTANLQPTIRMFCVAYLPSPCKFIR